MTEVKRRIDSISMGPLPGRRVTALRWDGVELYVSPIPPKDARDRVKANLDSFLETKKKKLEVIDHE